MKELNDIMDNIQEHIEDYELASDESLMDSIENFGSGFIEFHTADIERLIRQKQCLEKLVYRNQNSVVNLELFKQFKSEHIFQSGIAMIDGEISQYVAFRIVSPKIDVWVVRAYPMVDFIEYSDGQVKNAGHNLSRDDAFALVNCSPSVQDKYMIKI